LNLLKSYNNLLRTKPIETTTKPPQPTDGDKQKTVIDLYTQFIVDTGVPFKSIENASMQKILQMITSLPLNQKQLRQHLESSA
jgi:hypothetical protein